MYIGKQHAKKEYVDYLGNREETIIISDEGIGTFLCAAGSISVWAENA